MGEYDPGPSLGVTLVLQNVIQVLAIGHDSPAQGAFERWALICIFCGYARIHVAQFFYGSCCLEIAYMGNYHIFYWDAIQTVFNGPTI